MQLGGSGRRKQEAEKMTMEGDRTHACFALVSLLANRPRRR